MFSSWAFLKAIYMAGSSWRVEFDGADWRDGRAAICLWLKKRAVKKILRRDEKRSFGDRVNRERIFHVIAPDRDILTSQGSEFHSFGKKFTSIKYLKLECLEDIPLSTYTVI
jgi:hypothetical protein